MMHDQGRPGFLFDLLGIGLIVIEYAVIFGWPVWVPALLLWWLL